MKTCLICGHMCWRDPINDREYESIPRCNRPQECRDRLEARGEPWPLVDITVSRSRDRIAQS